MKDFAEIGHNNPPDPIDEAVAPFGDFISEAETWLDGEESVTTEAQMKAVDVILKGVRSAGTAVAKAEKASCAPLHDAWKGEKSRWKPTIDDLDRLKRGLVSLVGEYKKKLADEKEAARIEAAIAARRAEEESRAAAMQAQPSDLEAVRAAENAAIDAKAARVNAAQAQKDTVKGLRTVHKHEVVDVRDALHWIARNDKPAIEAFVLEYARQNHRTKAIDGVKSWSEKEAF